MAELYLYKCKKCGKLVESWTPAKPCPTMCCGEAMTLVKPFDTDGAKEKHVPFVSVEGNVVSVQVGEVLHPMTEAHLITDIVLITTNGEYRKHLEATDAPVAKFALLDDEKIVKCYEYCNLHSLWVVEF